MFGGKWGSDESVGNIYLVSVYPTVAAHLFFEYSFFILKNNELPSGHVLLSAANDQAQLDFQSNISCVFQCFGF